MSTSRAIGPFVKLQFDESALIAEFQHVNDRLDTHEEMIRELQRLMKNKPDRSELVDVNERLTTLIEDRTKALNEKIDSLGEMLGKKIKEIQENVDFRLADTANMLNLAMNQKFDELETKIPPGDTNMSDLAERLQSVEGTVYNNGKKLNTLKDHVQTIATSIGLLNNTNAILDGSLSNTLANSISWVTNNFKSIFDTLSNINDQVSTLKVFEKRAPQQEAVKNNAVSDIDITNIHPYPPQVADWKDSPDLPQITQFNNIGEVVDYIYKMVPKLQAHLTAMHGKIVENVQDTLGKVDKSLVEKMFEKFQSVIGEMANRVDELKNCVELTATRDEINDMVDEILNSMNQGGQTAIGRVRCIACGRDIPQVTGATTEEESNRMLGAPPNSFAVNSKGVNITVRYDKRNGFDSSIIESPRSIRPFKPSTQGRTPSKLISPR